MTSEWAVYLNLSSANVAGINVHETLTLTLTSVMKDEQLWKYVVIIATISYCEPQNVPVHNPPPFPTSLPHLHCPIFPIHSLPCPLSPPTRSPCPISLLSPSNSLPLSLSLLLSPSFHHPFPPSHFFLSTSPALAPSSPLPPLYLLPSLPPSLTPSSPSLPPFPLPSPLPPL